MIIGVTLFVISEAVPLDVALVHILVTVGDIMFGLGLMWIGYVLWREAAPAKQSKLAAGVSTR